MKSLIKIIIVSSLVLLVSYISFYYLYHHKEYKEKFYLKTNKIIEGSPAPRGKIFDKNGNVLVDNKHVNNVVFYKLKDIDLKEVIYKLSDVFEFDKSDKKEFIKYYKYVYNEENLLTENEKNNIKKRKIDKDKLINKKISKIINNYDEKELEYAKIYALLTEGYDYEPKIIKSNVEDELIRQVLERNIPGIKIESSFERIYVYDDTLKSILGTCGKVRKEHIKQGYKYDDIVGLSALEKQYDKYLKGIKAKYLVNNDNSLTLLEKEKKGSDLYLSIDIDLQMQVDNILKENIKRAKYYPYTNYFSDSYVIISNPKTGEINAISGWRLLNNNEFNDIAINNISSSYTMGSVVKGATISVGYQNNLINPQEYIYDGCVKLKNLTEKCSWKNLGYLNSVTALEQSSNYYQFLIAIKLMNKEYYPDMELNVSKKEFDIYRKTLASYGLGIKSGIDLPDEQIGLIGKEVEPDLYLNLAIGQYDTYTPIELLTYINTIADNGKKRKPSLVKKIVKNKKIIYENKYKNIGNVDIKDEDINRIQEGFYNVMNRGTGNNFMNKNINPAGKTGTSESFYDADFDGNIDISTISLSLAGYYPYEDPNKSIIIVSPNISYNNDNVYYVTASIAREITSLQSIENNSSS